MKKNTIVRTILLSAGIISLSYLSWNAVRIYGESSLPTEQLIQTDLLDNEQLVGGIAAAEAATVKTADINTLKVPSMNVDSRIWEGKTKTALSNGLWRIPGSSTPDKGGNTVIAAHRWKWLPASKKSFYDIDKVKVGEIITMQWAGKTYSYKVSKISTVTPDKVEVLKNTTEPKLTLFSCTPLFSTKYRLVVEADLITT